MSSLDQASLWALQIDGERAVGLWQTQLVRSGRNRVKPAPNDNEMPLSDGNAAVALATLAATHPNHEIAWLDVSFEPDATRPATWPALRRHPLELLHLGDVDPASPTLASLGWVEYEAPYLLPTRSDRPRATCLVSPRAGLVRASVLLALGFDPELGLEAALTDIALRGMAHGVFPLAEPRMRVQVPQSGRNSAGHPSTAEAQADGPPAAQPSGLVAGDVPILLRRYLDRRWVLVWLLANLCFEKRLPLMAALRGLRAPAPRKIDHPTLSSLRPEPQASLPGIARSAAVSASAAGAAAVEVVIPTLGRPRLLEDVLDDLAAQTEPPRRVVIVDQCPAPTASLAEAQDQRPELAVEPAGERPFEIERLTVAWTGACRARNLGLSRTRADCDWVLLLDDDVRFGPDLIAGMRATAGAYDAHAVNPRVHLPNQDPAVSNAGTLPRLWPRFAGVALLSRAACDTVGGFDRRLDGGYGEDFDYGMRLRRYGFYVVYDPALPVLHLHAPRGGFRAPHPHPWPAEGAESPKPSPTVLLSRRLHQTPTMRQGFLLFFVLAHLRSTRSWRWLRSVPLLRKRWRASVYWTDKLAHRTSVQWNGEGSRAPQRGSNPPGGKPDLRVDPHEPVDTAPRASS